MLKKIISGILTICFLTSALTACKTTTPTSGQESSTVKSSAASSSIKDEGKITIYSNAGGVQLATKPSDPAYLEKIKAYIKDKTGIEVNFIAPPKDAAAATEKLNLLLSSGSEIDTFKADISTYAISGAIQPIGDLVEKFGPNLKKTWPDNWAGGWAGMKTVDGKIWGVPELPALAGATVYFRDDILAKINVPMPKTTAEMKAALVAIKEKDPAGNGQTIPLLADMRGLNMALSAGWMDIGYNWDNRGFMDSDGIYKPMVFAPGYKDFITEMAQWYKEGLIYKESFTINKDRQLELGKTNRIASYCMWYTTATTPIQQLIQDASIPNVSLKVADPLTGPKGLTKSIADTYQVGWVISKNSKNPEGVIKYINWVQANLSNYLTVMSGFEGDTWAYEKNDPNGLSTVKLLNTDVVKYNSEFVCGSSFAYTKKYVTVSGGKVPLHNQYISDFITDNTKCKLPSTFGFSFLMNKPEIIKQVGSLEDMVSFLDAGTVKFIMGSRPMSEWDTFLKEIEKVGLQKWQDAYTAEYKKAKK